MVFGWPLKNLIITDELLYTIARSKKKRDSFLGYERGIFSFDSMILYGVKIVSLSLLFYNT